MPLQQRLGWLRRLLCMLAAALRTGHQKAPLLLLLQIAAEETRPSCLGLS